MEKVKWELHKETGEVKLPSGQVPTGADMSMYACSNNRDSDVVDVFETKEAALEALKEYQPDARDFLVHGLKYWYVTEYFVQANLYEVNDDGDESLIETVDGDYYAEYPAGCWDDEEGEE